MPLAKDRGGGGTGIIGSQLFIVPSVFPNYSLLEFCSIFIFSLEVWCIYIQSLLFNEKRKVFLSRMFER